MKNHYPLAVRMNDASVRNILANQCLDPSSPIYGVCEHHLFGYISAEQGLGETAALVMAYYTPDSAYYKNDLLLERAVLSMNHSLSLQHEDGTIDLPQTNFHCASTVAFTFFHLGPAYKVMRHFNTHTPLEDELDALIETYYQHAADGMINCGFHTPNHRWVISSALSYCYKALGRKDCLEHIHRFLNEGMDCDEEGEYTERSAGVYNTICNQALMVMACELDMPELLEHVKRNLRMVMKYIEPDNTINTLNSRRQDVGTSPSALRYYSNYLNMALLTGDGEFAWFADEMLTRQEALFTVGKPDGTPYCTFAHFLLHPEVFERMASIQPVRPNLNYEKHFVESGVVRWRQKDATVTLIKGRPMFAKLQWGAHTMHLRLAGCFFARGQFAAQTLEPIEGGYRLTFHDRWGYKRPLKEKPATSVWHSMDHSLRDSVAMQDFDLCVDVLFTSDNRFDLKIKASGCDRVPTKFEILLEKEGRYIRDEIELRMHGGDYLYHKGGTARYEFNDHQSLTIEGGFYEHYYGEQMRGTLPVNNDSAFIVMTAYTPFEQSVSFTWTDTCR